MYVRFSRVLAAFLQRLRLDTSGAAALFMALGLVPLLGATGLAVDSSLGYLLRSRLSKSLDAAGLAAGRMALSENAADVAESFFVANFGEDSQRVQLGAFEFELDETRQFVTLTATATAPTVFMRIFGQDDVTVSARTVIQRQTTGMELALVMDNTGSMWGSSSTLVGSPFQAMQDAAFDLIDIIYGNATEIDNLWISLVPYVASVNVGNWRTGWLTATDQVLTNPAAFGTQSWKGCVMARAYPFDTDDTPPATQPFSSLLFPSGSDNDWPGYKTAYTDKNSAKGPNLACGPEITPLSGLRSTIEAGIENMKPWSRGGTAGNLGLSWGWRTISPRWRGLWGGETPATLPLDYDAPLMDKVVVILTDGNNEFYRPYSAFASDYTAYGRADGPALGVLTKAQARARLDTRMAETCEAMKAEGISIYSIIFGSSPSTEARDLFRGCATEPTMYHYAPDQATLAKTFKSIGADLANLRIVE